MDGGLVVQNKISTLDKIRKYYLQGPEKAKLSEKQDLIRINVLKTWNLMINYHSDEQAIKTMMNECNDGAGCSRAQAYRYLQYAKSIFGNPEKNWKEAERYLIREDLMRLQQQAMRDKDGHLQLGVIKQRIKIAQLDKDTDQKFNPEKLKSQVYVLKPHPTALAMMEANKEGGVFDFNNVDTEEIPYQEVNEEQDE
jgi:hypothetical protein